MTHADGRDPLNAAAGQSFTRPRLEAGPQLIAMIGQRSLEQLAGQLRPVACQTCLDPLGGVANLAGDAVLSTAEVVVSAHHPSCRPPDLLPVRELPVVRPTAVAKAWILPTDAPKGHRDGSVVVVVHPSCDRLIARQQRGLLRSKWVNVTLDDLRPLGFHPGGTKERSELQDVTATLNDDSLIVSAPTVHTAPMTGIVRDAAAAAIANTWVVPGLPTEIRDALARSGQATVAVTMKVLPTDLSLGNVVAGIADRSTLIGQVHLSALDERER